MPRLLSNARCSPDPGRGRGAREVEAHLVTANGEIERDRQRFIADAVIVEVILETVGAIGQGGDVIPHQPFGPGRSRIQRGFDNRIAISSISA